MITYIFSDKIERVVVNFVSETLDWRVGENCLGHEITEIRENEKGDIAIVGKDGNENVPLIVYRSAYVISVSMMKKVRE